MKWMSKWDRLKSFCLIYFEHTLKQFDAWVFNSEVLGVHSMGIFHKIYIFHKKIILKLRMTITTNKNHPLLIFHQDLHHIALNYCQLHAYTFIQHTIYIPYHKCNVKCLCFLWLSFVKYSYKTWFHPHELYYYIW